MSGTRDTSRAESEASSPEPPPPPPPHPVRCPRCGYDQRGAIAQWQDRSPLEARCTECGYAYESAVLFDPYRQQPEWLVEFCRWRRFPRAVLMTMLRSLVPWRFWRWQNLAHPLRSGRLLLYVTLVVIVPAALLYVVLKGGDGIATRMVLQQQLGNINDNAPQNLAAHEAALERWEKATSYEDAPPRFRGRFDVRGTSVPSPEHGEQWDAYRERHIELERSAIEWLRAVIDDPLRVDHSFFAVAMEPILFPKRGGSSVRIVGGGRVDPLPGPPNVGLYVGVGAGPAGAPIFPFRYLSYMLLSSELVSLWLATLLGMVVLPLTLVLLPATRRRAKVRAVHFVRVTAYGLAIPTLLIWMATAFMAGNALGWASNDLLDSIEEIAAIAMPLSAAGWWYIAFRCHLCIRHAFWVTLVMGIMTILILLLPVGVTAMIEWLSNGGFQ